MPSPMEVVSLIAVVVVVWSCVAIPLARGLNRSPTMPSLDAPQQVLSMQPAGTARHPRVELEFHAHRHWGVKRLSFVNGSSRGWSLHLGFGAGCLCVDFYRQGRRP
jgi:hypothetical protein